MKQEKKRRIAFITNTYSPQIAGVVSVIKASIEALDSVEYESIVITLDIFDKWGYRPTNTSNIHYIPCQFVRNYHNKLVAIPFFPQKAIERILTEFKPDIIHSHHSFLLGQAALSVARRMNIPIVYTHHQVSELYSYFFYCPLFIGHNIAHRRAVLYANSVDRVIVSSKKIKENLVKSGVKTEIAIVPSCVQTCFIHENRPFKVERPDIPYRLFVVSRLWKEKNLSFVLDVFRLLPKDQFKLIIAGVGNDLPRLQKYAYKELRLLPSTVAFYSGYRPAELIPLYKEANLLLFPTYIEGESLVIAESLACGTPVIARDSPGVRDMIANGMNGFLVSNQKEMAEAIIQIKKDKDLQLLLQEYAWRTSRLYMIDVMLEKIIPIYESLFRQ